MRPKKVELIFYMESGTVFHFTNCEGILINDEEAIFTGIPAGCWQEDGQVIDMTFCKEYVHREVYS